MILNCDEKMAKHILRSLDVADQQCRYLQRKGHSQGDLWPLVTTWS